MYYCDILRGPDVHVGFEILNNRLYYFAIAKTDGLVDSSYTLELVLDKL